MKISNFYVPAWVSDMPSRPPNSIAALGGLFALLTLACTGILAYIRRRNSTDTIPNIQRYQWDTGVAGNVKKRWMWDSLKLLREGYSKVSPSSDCLVVHLQACHSQPASF